MLKNEKLDKKVLEFEQSKEKRIKKEAREKEEFLQEREERIINSKDPEDIYDFALEEEGAHIDKLEDAIISIGNSYYICMFAKYVRGAHIDKLEDALIDMGKAECICELAEAKKVKGAHRDKLEDAIIAIGDAEYIFLFAATIKGAHIDKLGDAIIATGDAEHIFLFAFLEGAHIDKFKLKKAIMAIDDIEYISYWLVWLANINTDKMELYLVLSKKFDLKLIGKTFEESFLDKLYFYKKTDTLEYLIENREIDINEIRLRIYFDYLNNPNSTEEDLEKCNEKYIRYLSMFYGEKNKDEEDKNNVKVKKIQK